MTDPQLIETGTETVAEFAARHGKTEQTIRNWIRKGTIPAIKVGRTHIIESDKADAALAAHKRGNGHGGGRANAVRPKQGSTDTKPRGGTAATQTESETLTPIEIQAEIKRHAAEGTVPDGAATLSEALNFRPEWIDAIVAMAGPLGVTQQKLDQRKTTEDIRRRMRENLVAEGKLVDAEKARAAFAAEADRVRTQLETLPGRIAASVAAVAWPTNESIDAVADLMAAAGCDADTVRAMRELLAVPDDLRDAVVAIAEQEVNRVRSEIGGPPDGPGNEDTTP